MTINYNNHRYTFRPCDCSKIMQGQLEDIAVKQSPEEKFDTHNGNTYIYIDGIGYGMKE